MTDEKNMIDILEACAKRRTERREFLRASSGAALASTLMLGGCFDDDDDTIAAPTPTPTPPTSSPTPAVSDSDILNFALNLEYLEAQFYSFASFGTGLAANLLGGTGTQGAVVSTGQRQVNFTDPVVRQYAREIAQDEIAHVRFIRNALGASAVSQPQIDIGTSPTGAFSNAARSAGLIGAGAAFDAYANDENFLLGAFIFEDVGVTAYKGAAPLITSRTFLEAAAGILAAEAYHAGLVRTVLYRKGADMNMLRMSTELISNARDSLDGATDIDQGVAPLGESSNIVPVDNNAIAYSRTTGQVLNIAYLNRMAVDRGGFFPTGVNGTIRLSAAN